MEALLRKYLWTLDLAVVALCASFLGSAGSSAVETKLVASLPDAKPLAKARLVSKASVTDKQTEGILKRNIFCSTCPPILDTATATGTATDTGPSDAEPVKTTLPLTIMAIMYAPPPNCMKWCMAVLRDSESKGSGPYVIGSKVLGATVIDISETRVLFDNQGKTEFLDLFELPAPPAPATPAAAPVAAAKDPFAQEMAKGIKKVNENKYELQRGTLESVLGNMSLLSRSARIVPEMRDGKAAGFRLFAVKPDGPFALIGMQNGDVISSINGLEITSPEKALEVYAKLKSASHLSLGLERNGQKVTKDYSIR